MRSDVQLQWIRDRILTIRGVPVMLDRDLAFLYGVRTKHLNQQVKRNSARFPSDFMFQLSAEESEAIRDRGPRGSWHGKLPYAFTEHGAGMLAAVLRSKAAARVTIHILRVFTMLRAHESTPPTIFDAVREVARRPHQDKRFTNHTYYTYFLQAGDDGPIKIGTTRNLIVRLRTLGTMGPLPLKLLGTMRGNHEDLCHTRLSDFRSHGEWFMPSPPVLEFIREHASAAPIVITSAKTNPR